MVVAGASGFVGRALGPVLAERHQVVGITRDPGRYRSAEGGTSWVAGELFSLLDAERALQGADYAVYLVHSMMPTARLTQGSFRDLDVICADNFARAAKAAGVKHIVYLGGPLPERGELSEHLASRLEVEKVLGAYGVPVTTIRAGMVIGAGGSSYQMMVRLVRRLPAMVCPRWTASLTQPVALDDVVKVIAACLGDERFHGRAYDVGVPEPLSYRDMMDRTAKLMGIKRPMLGVPLLSPTLSRLWVSVVTGAPRELVAPLVQSLRHDLVAKSLEIYELTGTVPTTFEDALSGALEGEGVTKERPHAFVGQRRASGRTVRSVQRLPLPSGRDAIWAAEDYMRFLPRALWPLVRVEVSPTRLSRFFLRGLRQPLLELDFAADRSRPDRQLFYVVGGLLARRGGRGRLELRCLPGGEELICAVHDFEPRLPWYLYLLTQAWAHLYVVARFRRRLTKLKAERPLQAPLRSELVAKLER